MDDLFNIYDFDLDHQRFRVAHHEGIAFRCVGVDCEDQLVTDNDGNQEWQEVLTGTLRMVAVGDDYIWHIDYSDVDPLEDDDTWCHTCGQIGCRHG